mgnify:CR=1 FL=1
MTEKNKTSPENRKIITPTDVPDLVAAASVLIAALKRTKKQAHNLQELFDLITTNVEIRTSVALTDEQRKLIGAHAGDLAGIRIKYGGGGVKGATTNLYLCPSCNRWLLSETVIRKCLLTLGCQGEYIKSPIARPEPIS